jgi:hypothetical protein
MGFMRKQYGYLTASLDDEQFEKLRAIALKEGRSVPKQAGELLRMGLIEYQRLESIRANSTQIDLSALEGGRA